MGNILADPADINRVVVRCLGGCSGITPRYPLVHDCDAWRIFKQPAGFGRGELLAGLYMNHFRVPEENRKRELPLH